MCFILVTSPASTISGGAAFCFARKLFLMATFLSTSLVIWCLCRLPGIPLRVLALKIISNSSALFLILYIWMKSHFFRLTSKIANPRIDTLHRSSLPSAQSPYLCLFFEQSLKQMIQILGSRSFRHGTKTELLRDEST